jgi:hypothetical protein
MGQSRRIFPPPSGLRRKTLLPRPDQGLLIHPRHFLETFFISEKICDKDKYLYGFYSVVTCFFIKLNVIHFSVQENQGEYIEEMAVMMVEAALAPFEREMFRLIDLGMSHDAKICCMGILKGIHRYETESRSAFKDWAVDVPGECFGDILDEWKKRTRNRDHIDEMDMFLKRECRW